MRRIILTLHIITLISTLTFSQTVLRGTIHHATACKTEASSPLSAVSVSVDGVNDITNSNGEFSLTLPNRQYGQDVSITISRAGYVMINTGINLNTYTLSSNRDKLPRFYMCSEREFTISSGQNRAASQAAMGKQLDDKLGALKAELVAELSKKTKDTEEYKSLQLQIEEIERQRNRIKEELDKSNKNLEAYTWKEDTEMLINVMNTVLKGSNEKEDYQVFDDVFIDLFAELTWNSYTPEELDSMQQIRPLEEQQKLNLYSLRSYFHLIDYQYEKAQENMEKALAIDADNVSFLITYATVLRARRKYKEAVPVLENILMKADRKSLDYIEAANSLATIYLLTDQTNKAEKILDEASNALKAASRDTTDHVLKVHLRADIYQKYGSIYLKKHEYRKAEEQYFKSRSIYIDELQQERRLNPDLAYVDNILGKISTHLNNFSDAQNYYQYSIGVYNSLVQVAPESYLLQQSDVAFNMGDLHFKRNDFKSATGVYDQIEKVYSSLKDQGDPTMEPYLANIYVAQGNVFLQRRNYQRALSKYGEAKRIYVALANDQPDVYDSKVSDILNNIGLALLKLKQYDKSSERFYEVLSIDEKLTNKAPEIYKPELALTYRNIGSYHTSLSNYDSAYHYYSRSLDIYEEYARKNERVYKNSLLGIHKDLGIYYFKKGEDEKAKQEIDVAYQLAKELVAIDSTVFLPNYAQTVSELGLIYLNEERPDVALSKIEESYQIFDRLSKKQEDVYESQKANLLFILGKLHAILDEGPRLANEYYNRAEQICDRQMKKNEENFLPVKGKIYFERAQLSAKNNDDDSALRHYEKANELITKVLSNNNTEEYKSLLGEIQLAMAQIYIDQQDFTSANNALNRAKQFYNRLLENNYQPEYLVRLGEIEEASGRLYEGQKDYFSAKNAYIKAQNHFQKLYDENPPKYHVRACDVSLKIAEMESDQGHNSRALNSFGNIIDTAQRAILRQPAYERDYASVLARAYFNIGGVELLENPDKAATQFVQALKYYEQLATRKSTYYDAQAIFCNINIGIIHFNKQEMKTALRYFQQSLEKIDISSLEKSRSMTDAYITSNKLIGDIYYESENHDIAAPYYEECIKYFPIQNTPTKNVELAKLKTHSGICNIRGEEGEKGERQLEEARQLVMRHMEYQEATEIYQLICEYIDCY